MVSSFMAVSLVLALLVGVDASGSQMKAKGTPIQKVIEMMNEMLSKGKAEKEAEIKMMDEYTEWVDDTSRETGFEIKTAKSAIEELTAEAEKADADVAELTEKIEELDGQIASWEADQKAATQLRESEKAEYMKISTDYGESLDALDRAITVLGKQQGSTSQLQEQAEVFLQQMATTTRGMRRVLAGFLAQKADMQDAADASGGPAVAAYEGQSGGIVEMLEKLKKKFKQELDVVNEEEANKAHAYDLEMLHLGNSIDAAKDDVSKKTESKAQRAQDSAEAKGTLADTKMELAELEKFMAEVKSTFQQKSSAFEMSQKVRGEEIAAITKAIEIMSDVGFAQTGAKGVSLLQMSRSTRHMAQREQTSDFLRRQAEKLGSKVLSLAAIRLGFDPFAKVIKMLKELIARLEEEAAAEAAHKAWCDGELKENKETKDAKNTEVAEITAHKEKLEGEIGALAKDLEDLAAAQLALAKAMKEATALREKEKAENEVTIKDAKEAQEAVNQALTVLREFYNKQAGFLQERQALEMKEYKGQGGSATGVVGMLEVILSDFARVEAETSADETQGAKEYDTFMADSKADGEAKHDEEFDKGLLKDKKEHELKGTKKDLASVQKELNAALAYYEELKPQCLEVHVSYEERVAKRKEEIESLQAAYKALSAQ